MNWWESLWHEANWFGGGWFMGFGTPPASRIVVRGADTTPVKSLGGKE